MLMNKQLCLCSAIANASATANFSVLSSVNHSNNINVNANVLNRGILVNLNIHSSHHQLHAKYYSNSPINNVPSSHSLRSISTNSNNTPSTSTNIYNFNTSNSKYIYFSSLLSKIDTVDPTNFQNNLFFIKNSPIQFISNLIKSNDKSIGSYRYRQKNISNKRTNASLDLSSTSLNDNSILATVGSKVTCQTTTPTFSCQTTNNNALNNDENKNNINTDRSNGSLNPNPENGIPFKITPKIITKEQMLSKRSKNMTFAKLIDPYIALSKPRLTVLVMLSSICSYALSPYPATVSQLLFLTAGTSLASASANAINMGREPDFDRRMVRTSTRPVVTGIVTPMQAYKFATITGIVGVSMLYLGVNATVATLGGLNIVLYAWIYTSLKRKHIINTWIGAIVGAIPPLMGWASSSSLLHPGAWCLAGLLYAWQFPHFNSLSHNIRYQYKEAGYVMTAFENPKLNARVGLRYSLLMFPLCFGLSYWNICDWVFPFDSAVLNAWLSYVAFQFWRQQRKNYGKNGDSSPNSPGMKLANIQAKKLFWG
ncbi:protoheme IX farnesyltransferase, partial [Ascoidea rubescens DSM 1968]